MISADLKRSPDLWMICHARRRAWPRCPATVAGRPGDSRCRPPRVSEAPAALLDLSDDDLLARIAADPTSLGSLSIGTPGRATLFNSVALPPNPHWQIAPNADSYATSETVAFLQAAIDTVYDLFPETPPIMIGDISAADGGRLKRHQSHQGGRDVDCRVLLQVGQARSGSCRRSPANFDLARNWALVRSLVTRTDVEMILLDTRVQRMLYKYALGLGEDKDFLDHVFACGRGLRDAIVQHVVGHRTHYHVRFYNAVAQELGRRAHPLLVQLNLMKPAVYTVSYVVRKGQTLGQMAARYGTSVRAIQQANGLRTTRPHARDAPTRSRCAASARADHAAARGAPPHAAPVHPGDAVCGGLADGRDALRGFRAAGPLGSRLKPGGSRLRAQGSGLKPRGSRLRA